MRLQWVRLEGQLLVQETKGEGTLAVNHTVVTANIGDIAQKHVDQISLWQISVGLSISICVMQSIHFLLTKLEKQNTRKQRKDLANADCVNSCTHMREKWEVKGFDGHPADCFLVNNSTV